jgi:hypothetical protein
MAMATEYGVELIAMNDFMMGMKYSYIVGTIIG